MTDQPICSTCKHKRYGQGVLPPRTDIDRVPHAPRPTTDMGDLVCIRHPRGRTPINPVTGLGGDVLALYCEDVNKGSCPDYERGYQDGEAVWVFVFVAIVLSIILAIAIAWGPR